MAKVLLIRPQQIHWKDEAKRLATPVGLLSIAGFLRNAGHEVDFIDAAAENSDNEREVKLDVFEFGLNQNELEKRILEADPEFVGIQSMLTSYWNQAKNVAETVKKVKPNAKVIIGGQHATGVADWIALNEHSIDYVIAGEGEIAFTKLIKNHQNHSKIIKGSALCINESVNPAFDLLDNNLYKSDLSHYGQPRGKTFITNLISRGCPSSCTYCTSSYYFGKKIRTYTTDQISAQIELIKALGFDEYISMDDNVFSLPPLIRKHFIESLGSSGLHWNLDGGLYYPLINQSFIEEIGKNGCYRVFLPVENPDVSIMHNYNKYLNLHSNTDQRSKVNYVINLLKENSIEFYSGIMIGFPGESWGSIKKALDYGKELKDKGALGVGFHWVHPYPFTPFHKASYSMIPDNRKWENSPEYYTFVKPVFPIDGISLEEAYLFVKQKTLEINKTKHLNYSMEFQNNN